MLYNTLKYFQSSGCVEAGASFSPEKLYNKLLISSSLVVSGQMTELVCSVRLLVFFEESLFH